MSKIAFLVEGLSHNVGLNTRIDETCKFLKSLEAKDFIKHQDGNAFHAIAYYNGLLTFDPIEGYNNPNVIYNFISGLKGNKTLKAKFFDLIIIRAAKEFVVQIFPPTSLKSQEEILQYIKKVYAIDMYINDISPNFIPQITKAFFKLKGAGYFEDTYRPDSIYQGEAYSIKKAAQYIEKHYKIPDITYGADFITNLDQYIAKKITPKLIKICNENSKANLQNIVAENPDLKEIYAFVGSNHLSIFSEDLAIQPYSGHKKYDPKHLNLTIGDKLLKLHLFPDSHFGSHTYSSFKAYARNHGIKMPNYKGLKEIIVKHTCETTQRTPSKYYFTDEELSFLICATVENYSNYTVEQCRYVLDELKNDHSSFALCSAPSGEVKDKYWWYQDFVAREICSPETVQQQDEL